MSVPDQYSLRWNDFHTNLSSASYALFLDKDLVDVTLAAGGQYVHAHKLILSICSPYFKELFKVNPCDHPIVILKDVEVAELRLLLDFMYKGEVNVRHHELDGFLRTAAVLKIKGLTKEREQAEANYSSDDTQDILIEDHDISLINSDTEECNSEVSYDIEFGMDGSSGPVNNGLLQMRSHNTTEDYNGNNDDNDGEMSFESELYRHGNLGGSMPEGGDPKGHKQDGFNGKTGGVKCPSCHRYFANRYNLKVHVRDKHETLEGTLYCQICQKKMRNPSCLRVHLYHHRKQAAIQMISKQTPSIGDGPSTGPSMLPSIICAKSEPQDIDSINRSFLTKHRSKSLLIRLLKRNYKRAKRLAKQTSTVVEGSSATQRVNCTKSETQDVDTINRSIFTKIAKQIPTIGDGSSTGPSITCTKSDAQDVDSNNRSIFTNVGNTKEQ